MRAIQMSLAVGLASLALAACTSGSGNLSKTGAAGTGAGAAGTGASARRRAGAAGGDRRAAPRAAAPPERPAPRARPPARRRGGGHGRVDDDGRGGHRHRRRRGRLRDGDRDGSTEHGDGPLTTAGCANHNYQLCLDFENGIDTATWTGGTPGAIVTDEVAHGTHAYHLYASGTGKGGRRR